MKAKQAGSTAKTMAIAGSYDLGMAKVGVITIKLDEDSTSTANTRKVTFLSAAVPMGNGLTLIGAHHDYSNDATSTQNGATGTVIVVTKALSKQTTVYGGYGAVRNDANTTYNLGINDSQTNVTAGADPKTYAIGVRHVF